MKFWSAKLRISKVKFKNCKLNWTIFYKAMMWFPLKLIFYFLRNNFIESNQRLHDSAKNKKQISGRPGIQAIQQTKFNQRASIIRRENQALLAESADVCSFHRFFNNFLSYSIEKHYFTIYCNNPSDFRCEIPWI